MVKWGVLFQIYKNLGSFPYPTRIEKEEQNSPLFHRKVGSQKKTKVNMI